MGTYAWNILYSKILPAKSHTWRHPGRAQSGRTPEFGYKPLIHTALYIGNSAKIVPNDLNSCYQKLEVMMCVCSFSQETDFACVHYSNVSYQITMAII